MTISQIELYKLMFAEHHYASDWREKIVRGYCLMLAGLAVVFAWIQEQAKDVSWIVPAVATVATLVMWLGDYRNRAGIHGAKDVGAAIENRAGIHKKQRFFNGLEPESRLAKFLTHGSAINIFALVAVFVFLWATWYLWDHRGVLPGFTPPTVM